MRSAAHSSMAPVSASRQWSRSTAAMSESVSANPMPSARPPVTAFTALVKQLQVCGSSVLASRAGSSAR